MNDEYFRKNPQSKVFPSNYPKRNVADLEFSESSDYENTIGNELSIDAVEQRSNSTKCWNCDQLGHHWQDCLENRTIFCYGCGEKNTYRPQCKKCSRKVSASKNLSIPSQPPKF